MASVPNPSLDAGMAALEQGDYSLAIAHLEGVCEIELDETLVSQAAMGLVTAYRNSGNATHAITLCQRLTEDPNPKIKEWAVNTLANLTAEFPASQDHTGFVPLDSSSPDGVASDPTGFVPFNQTTAQPQTPQQTTPSTIKQRLVSSAKRLFSGVDASQTRSERPISNRETPTPSN
ncbi:MAG TPA: Zn-dependent protease with chaperone function, partial [Cyanobacteria bacterium UBA9273]|nr:Zn-dependent protease with chaperone function [Cyanobacteria bacterium UBA9273]